MAFNNSQKHYEILALEEQNPKTTRFVSLSIMAHCLLIFAAANLSQPMVERPQVETVEFELADTTTAIPEGIITPETRGAAPAVDRVAATPVVETKAETIIPTPAPAKVAVTTKASPVSTVSTPKTVVSLPTPVVLNDSLDDIATPDLSEFAVPTAASNNSNLTDQLSEIDEILPQTKASPDFSKVAESLNQEVESYAGVSDVAIESSRAQQQEKLAALQAARAQQRAQEEALMASALSASGGNGAGEDSELAALAKAQEQELANQATLPVARGNGGGRGTGTGETIGAGAGNNGADEASKGLAGSPQGKVRSLEQLRQMPGNPRPMYSVEERKNGLTGVVAFHAYVNKEGRLTQFRKISSTGHASLDNKTLAALKRWKFYPGQEGWVELPFAWDLKGGPVAIGGGLRTAHR